MTSRAYPRTDFELELPQQSQEDWKQRESQASAAYISDTYAMDEGLSSDGSTLRRISCILCTRTEDRRNSD
ncbi:hypothetical protein VTN02DRAFT_6008 [Thermoascus thermophilus]